jgi:hypothetical protein
LWRVEVKRLGWIESGRAWGERAADWAYLAEPDARRVNDALFDRAGVGAGTRLLDIACGSGLPLTSRLAVGQWLRGAANRLSHMLSARYERSPWPAGAS